MAGRCELEADERPLWRELRQHQLLERLGRIGHFYLPAGIFLTVVCHWQACNHGLRGTAEAATQALVRNVPARGPSSAAIACEPSEKTT